MTLPSDSVIRTSEENERWYDEEIAPKLAQLCELCQQREMSFISVVEYAPGSHSRTFRLAETAGLEMVMINHCAQTAPNIDGFIIGLIKYCREKGIDTRESFVMQRMGS